MGKEGEKGEERRLLGRGGRGRGKSDSRERERGPGKLFPIIARHLHVQIVAYYSKTPTGDVVQGCEGHR